MLGCGDEAEGWQVNICRVGVSPWSATFDPPPIPPPSPENIHIALSLSCSITPITVKDWPDRTDPLN